MSVLNRFWPKDKLVQKTIEIKSGLYDEIEFLCENVYDTSVSKIINACIDELMEQKMLSCIQKKQMNFLLNILLFLERAL